MVEATGFASGLDVVYKRKRVKDDCNFCDLSKCMNNGACLSLFGLL